MAYIFFSGGLTQYQLSLGYKDTGIFFFDKNSILMYSVHHWVQNNKLFETPKQKNILRGRSFM